MRVINNALWPPVFCSCVKHKKSVKQTSRDSKTSAIKNWLTSFISRNTNFIFIRLSLCYRFVDEINGISPSLSVFASKKNKETITKVTSASCNVFLVKNRSRNAA